jgi:hypothetical protein
MTLTDRITIYGLATLFTVVIAAFAFGWLAFKKWRVNQQVISHDIASLNYESRKREEDRHDQDLARAQQVERKLTEFEKSLAESLHQQQVQLKHSLLSAEESRYRVVEAEQDRYVASNSGAGSGGYVLIDVPEADRSLFHDLAKGFEDYARLKGYGVSLSIDNSWAGHTAYKFTVHSRGVAVGSEQVRKDFKEYAERVRHDDDDFEDMPVITNMAEHNLMVTMLKNRVVFFRANYKAYKNTVTLLEKLIASNHFFPALPQSP